MGFKEWARVFQSESMGKDIHAGVIAWLKVDLGELALQEENGHSKHQQVEQRNRGKFLKGSVGTRLCRACLLSSWFQLHHLALEGILRVSSRATWSHWGDEVGLPRSKGIGKRRCSRTKMPGSKSWLCHLLSGWLGMNYVTSFCLTFFVCKMGLILIAPIAPTDLLQILNKPHVKHLYKCLTHANCSVEDYYLCLRSKILGRELKKTLHHLQVVSL